jgi:hypothetical protein
MALNGVWEQPDRDRGRAGQANLDLALSKTVMVNSPLEKSSFQFRAEFYNALNHPHFANNDSNFTSPTFGVISSTAVSARGTAGAEVCVLISMNRFGHLSLHVVRTFHRLTVLRPDQIASPKYQRRSRYHFSPTWTRPAGSPQDKTPSAARAPRWSPAVRREIRQDHPSS